MLVSLNGTLFGNVQDWTFLQTVFFLSIVSSYCFKLFPQGACPNSNSLSSYSQLKLLIVIDEDKSRVRKLSTFVYIFYKVTNSQKYRAFVPYMDKF